VKQIHYFLFLVSITVFAQPKNLIYYPDGKLYVGKSETIHQLNEEFAKGIPVYIFHTKSKDDFTTVGFKMFTNKPIWVITKNPEHIQKYVNEFNLLDFLNSWEFKFEIDRCIEKRNLTDLFLLQSLGKPDKKIIYGESKNTIEEWQYYSLGISLLITNSIVTRYIKVE
jgi:hypothetical protein